MGGPDSVCPPAREPGPAGRGLISLGCINQKVQPGPVQALGGSEGHHCSYFWALASRVTPVSTCGTQG